MSRRPHRLFLLGFLLSWVPLLSSAELPALALGDQVEPAPGMDWELADGTTLHLRVVDRQFHLYQLDAERRVVEPTLARAIVRGEETRNKTNEVNLLLRPGDGLSLSHPRRVYLPVDYWLRLLVPDPVDGPDALQALPRQRFVQ